MRTRVGYTGGTLKDPTYHNLGDHTETIQIDFDPSKVAYAELLDIFWSCHNPCARAYSRQYISAIFTNGEEQRKLAEESKRKQEAARGKIATEILPAGKFYVAEDYHQKYYLRGAEELMKEFQSFYPDPAAFRESTAAARVNGYVGGDGSPDRLKAEIDSLGLSVRGREALQRHVR